MIDENWIKLITPNETFEIQSKIKGVYFLEDYTEYPITINNNKQFNGIDGEKPGAISFAPFNLVVRFGIDGRDVTDKRLAEEQLKSLLNIKERYYINTSFMPGIKYAVESPVITPEILDFSASTYEVTFTVFKGYSESMYDTSHIRVNDDTWQFESGIQINDESLKYKHNTSGFKIFNGSADKIDPLLDHNLAIYINIDAPNGFILWNRTTDERFVYDGAVNSTQAFTIKGVHPLLDGKRVGHNSNWQWITLEKGYNDFQFLGDGISNINIEFVFNFIYR